jgi:type VI secretion system secreted protein Hcp
MPFDAFLKLTDIKGESLDDKHKDEIEIQSFAWGLAQTGTTGGGGGGSTGVTSFEDFSFTADISKASPLLFFACASGQHLQEGILTVRRAGQEQQEYYKVTLSDVVVSRYDQGASTEGDLPMDEFALNYAKIEVEYRAQKADGSLDDPIKRGWDRQKNVKA